MGDEVEPTAEIPKYCPGLKDPRCKGMCTVDMRDNRIVDPDCFRSY